MAQRPDELGGASFTEWLRAVCQRGGVKSPKLHFSLIREGYFCREESVRRWIRGSAEPPARAIPAILQALSKTAEGVDVWIEFDSWLHGRPFLAASRGSEAEDDTELRGRDSNPQPSGIRASQLSQDQTGQIVLLNSRRRRTDTSPSRLTLVRGELGGLQG
jgi:hypothetical protein